MKRFKVIFSPSALDDAEQIVAYYDKLQTDFGKRFAVQLKFSLNAIKRNPFFASIRYDNIRCVQVKKFPYLVHYTINDTHLMVTIIAIYSTYREPLLPL